jgi:hypothetical protein
MEPIRLAIVGIDRQTDQLLTCLIKSDRLKLCAICETQPPLLNKYREKYSEIQFFDDPREMVLREKPNILLLWRDSCGNDFANSIIEKGCWLILRPPIQGGLSAAMRTIKLAEKNKVGVFVWTPWLFLPCFESMQDWLTGQQIRSFWCNSINTLTDLELPAEETLLAAGMYPYLFLAQRWLGIPEQVFCRQLFRPAQSKESFIQFFGLANLVYPQALGMVTIGINAGPAEEEILLTSNAGQVRAEPTKAHLFDCSGNLVAASHQYELAEARQIAITRHFDRIWQSVIEQQRSTEFELKRHLGVLAILEAAALSAKTGHPEQLAKIIDLNTLG